MNADSAADRTLFVTFPAAGARPGSLGWVADLAAGAGQECLAMSNASSTEAVSTGRWRADAVREIRMTAGRAGARRVVLVGHSMGGLSAVCLRRDLETELDVPVVVVTLNTPCPDDDGRIPTLSNSSDVEIAAALDGSGGPALVQDPALLAELADDIRADAEVADALALTVEVAGIGDLHVVTARDDGFIDRDRCAAWRHRVSGDFRLEQIEGNHMLLGTPPETLTGVLRSALAPRCT